MSNSLNFNIKELEKLQNKLKRLASSKSIDTFYKGATKEVCARLLSELIKNTDVNKKGVQEYIVQKNSNGDKLRYKRNSAKHRKNDVKVKVVTVVQGGTLRRGWTSKTHKEAVGGSGNGKDTLSYANKVMINVRNGIYTADIINPVKYASYYEYGHRQNQPIGMFVPTLAKRITNKTKKHVPGRRIIRKSLMRVNPQKINIIKKRLKAYLKELEM